MKINSLFISGLLILVCLTAGCNQNTTQKAEVSGGKTNEIIAVMKGSLTWDSKIGDTIIQYFEQADTMLSQPEELFSVATITHQQFETSNFFFHHHNILIINKDTSIVKPTVETKENVWATPQRVVWINFADDSSFFTLFSTYQSTILKMFDDLEIIRTNNTMKLGSNQLAGLTLEKIFQFKMDIPAGFSVARQDSNFLWLTQRVESKSQDLTAGIMIWQRPYNSENQFSMNELVKSRNTIARQYISGPIQGSFMKTSVEFIPPTTKVVSNFPVDYAVEMRGLWDMVGDFMGGPFISYTFLNPKTDQLITVEGFVYNPNHKKRVFLRQMQSVFWHLSVENLSDAPSK
ncbi:MAG: DUF4837 family protein [Bacteroidales bacterium]|nr:DUF4837 family protein [Bacteroidales bacterium]